MKNNRRNYNNNSRDDGPRVSGIAVEVKNGQFERALRKFKKKVTDSGIIQEVRDRKHFVKPSEIKRKAKDAGKKRWKRKQRMSELD
jgi:small subunit ribosomal protein S21|tara:strand:- start:356 stop:613 length:258 start_codon:yes stop_codon:yes gene_type:complete